MKTQSVPLRNALKHGRYATQGPLPLPEVKTDRFDACFERFRDELEPHEQVNAGLLIRMADAWYQREQAHAGFLLDLRRTCAGLRELGAGAPPAALEATLRETARFLETSLRLLGRHAGHFEDALYLARAAQRRALRQQAGRQAA